MDLKAYYVDVEIKGTALIYAKTEIQAKELLEFGAITVAGNKLRKSTIFLMSKLRKNIINNNN
jgi:hypothetical protein